MCNSYVSLGKTFFNFSEWRADKWDGRRGEIHGTKPGGVLCVGVSETALQIMEHYHRALMLGCGISGGGFVFKGFIGFTVQDLR